MLLFVKIAFAGKQSGFVCSGSLQDFLHGIGLPNAVVLCGNKLSVQLPCDATKRFPQAYVLSHHAYDLLFVLFLYKMVIEVFPAEWYLAFALTREIFFPQLDPVASQMNKHS